jgi:hypothetical protein
MYYRFIRTGRDATVQNDNEDVIRDCFAFCTADVRARLERFFEGGQPWIEFDFGESVVRLERV